MSDKTPQESPGEPPAAEGQGEAPVEADVSAEGESEPTPLPGPAPEAKPEGEAVRAGPDLRRPTPPTFVLFDDRRAARRRWTRAAAALAVAATAGTGAWIWLAQDPQVTDPGPGFDGGPGYFRARALLDDARADFKRGRFAECLKKLDEAKGLYPDGDREPDVLALREQAQAGLASPPASAP